MEPKIYRKKSLYTAVQWNEKEDAQVFWPKEDPRSEVVPALERRKYIIRTANNVFQTVDDGFIIVKTRTGKMGAYSKEEFDKLYELEAEFKELASTKQFNFGQALEKLKAGERITRSGWNGKNMYLKLQEPDENSKMSLPYIYMYTAQGDFVPWLASQTDMLAEDWEVYVPTI